MTLPHNGMAGEDKPTMENSNETGSFFGGLLIGALIGAISALLLAPHSGERTRAKLMDAGEEALSHGETLLDDARQRAEAIVADAQRKAEKFAETARDSVQAGKKEMNRVIDEESRALKNSHSSGTTAGL